MFAANPIIVDIGIYAGASTTVIGLCITLYRWKWFRGFLLDPITDAHDERRREVIADVIEQVIPKYIAPLAEELRPNGGSSFRDFVAYQHKRNHDLLNSLTASTGLAKVAIDKANENSELILKQLIPRANNLESLIVDDIIPLLQDDPAPHEHRRSDDPEPHEHRRIDRSE